MLDQFKNNFKYFLNSLKRRFDSVFKSHSLNPQNLSVQKTVYLSGVSKRKNFRINYPPFQIGGPYPHVFFKDKELLVSNISAGGLLLLDHANYLGNKIGHEVSLTLGLNNKLNTIRTRMVGVNLEFKHIAFLDFDPQLLIAISQITKPAYLGSNFRLIENNKAIVQSKELWAGPTGETLVFSFVKEHVEYFDGRKRFYISSKNKSAKDGSGLDLTEAELFNLILQISNFPDRTKNIKNLLETIFSIIQFRARHHDDLNSRTMKIGTDD
jgi:hypothetical protein